MDRRVFASAARRCSAALGMRLGSKPVLMLAAVLLGIASAPLADTDLSVPGPGGPGPPPDRTVCWSQPADYSHTAVSSEVITVSALETRVANDFLFGADLEITHARWWGQYYNYSSNMPDAEGFNLYWYEDSGSTCLPHQLICEVIVPNNCNETLVHHTDVFEYSIDLDLDRVFSAGVRYWFVVQCADHRYLPGAGQWGRCGAGGIQECESVIISDYFGIPDWTPLSELGVSDYDGSQEFECAEGGAGACCHPDGHCTYVLEPDCPTGNWRTGVSCFPNPCPPPGGACCFPDGHCEFLVESECGGAWLGYGSSCEPNPCSLGACCHPDGHCEQLIASLCQTSDWRVDVPCDPNPCPQPDGACCLAGGYCELLPEAQCPGYWLGYGTDCEPTPCVKGACCFSDGHCELTPETECPGLWLGYETSCEPNPCVRGACCYPDGHCTSVFVYQCPTGDWRLGIPCEPNPCPQPDGACCFSDGHCELIPDAQCPGVWLGYSIGCDPNPCVEGACCYPDGHCANVIEYRCPTGDWRPDIPCDPNPCPQPEGACCDPGGSCIYTTEDQCLTGDWRIGVPCDPNPCVGACCLDDSVCQMLSETQCAAAGGWYAGAPSCDPNPCISIPTRNTTWGRIKSLYK